MKYIDRIKINNFKVFEFINIEFHGEKNILIGENGVGKTTILEAIRLVLSGSISMIENSGLHSLFNVNAIDKFMNSDKNIEKLPILEIELFINEMHESQELNGVHHSLETKESLNGLKLTISPDHDNYSKEIRAAMKSNSLFPYEYYKVEFRTFGDQYYSPYKKYKNPIKYNFVRSSMNNNKMVMREYVDSIYELTVKPEVRKTINAKFRENTTEFIEKLYEEDLSSQKNKFCFNHLGSNSFQNNLTLIEKGVDINNFGHGEKLLLKVKSRLQDNSDVQVLLMEEPENHLSYLNMHQLVQSVEESGSSQMFITTHSNMIASRLNLRNLILLSETSACSFNSISEDTAKYFEKAPDSNLLNFILCKKAILVEGDAEYILMEDFYKRLERCSPIENHIAIISCGGTTFNRYLEVASLLDKKVAVITDNDEKSVDEVVKLYEKYVSNQIKIFTDEDVERRTFEICLYEDNKVNFEKKLKSKQMNKGLLEYMLHNKTESAYRILTSFENEDINIPFYIKEAIAWIK